eukprot:Tamp_18859.p2 GENE.Tamp_18859~~Tamp_18859.p2  ORF type:complete len:171 (-),score=43.53 Tamp_18859:781-1269(-)
MAGLVADVELEKADGSKVAGASLKDCALVAYYFSAHWCPPCQAFTPILKDLYNDLNDDGAKKMEVVFVSSDDNEAAMRSYMKEAHADWLTVPFDHPLRNEMKRKYGVCAGKEQEAVGVTTRLEGIPTLLICKADGTQVSMNGCQEAKDGPPAYKKWLAAVAS